MRKSKNDTLSTQRHCNFCVNNVKAIDYKDTSAMRRYMSSYSKIVPRRRSGVCSAHQRKLANAIKRARYMAIVPYLTR